MCARPLNCLDGRAGVIGYVMTGAGQHIEYAGLAAVRVADERDAHRALPKDRRAAAHAPERLIEALAVHSFDVERARDGDVGDGQVLRVGKVAAEVGRAHE